MQNDDKTLPKISLAGRGQMLITLEPIKFCRRIHFNIV